MIGSRNRRAIILDMAMYSNNGADRVEDRNLYPFGKRQRRTSIVLLAQKTSTRRRCRADKRCLSNVRCSFLALM